MRVHFISIGGSVMHQLAIALHLKGYQVSGSDDDIFEPAWSNLQAHGLLPQTLGWHEENIQPDTDAVILGMHARADNPELIKARLLNLPLYSFPEYILKESLQKTRVVVGGSHGKTTTTSMIMHVLQQLNMAFDYLVGARLQGFPQSVKISDAPILVCEGDEYPASALMRQPKFHFLAPHIAIITGIAWDHINIFPTFENYVDQFRIFIEKIEPGGQLIYNETDPELVKLINANPRTDLNLIPYRIPKHTIQAGHTYLKYDQLEVKLLVFGSHNLLNLEAARLACAALGVDTLRFAQSIASFTGAAKRLELIWQNNHAVAYRDFAHAPSKLVATVEAVAKQQPEKKLIAVFELHTYSSLNQDFLPEYRNSLQAASAACVYYSQHALEIKKMPLLPAEEVRAGFGQPDMAVINQPDQLTEWIQQHKAPNTVYLFMSSGTFDGLNLQAVLETDPES